MKTMTYFLYIILWEGFILGGCAYIVFWKGFSGWWFLLAVLLSGSPYSPSKWAELYNQKGNSNND